jgi:hypothetical protein
MSDSANYNIHRKVFAMLYTWRKDPWYPLYRRLGNPQSQSGCRG